MKNTCGFYLCFKSTDFLRWQSCRKTLSVQFFNCRKYPMVSGTRVIFCFVHMIKVTTFPGGILQSWWISLLIKSEKVLPQLNKDQIPSTNTVEMYKLLHSNFIHVLWFASVILILKALSNIVKVRFSSLCEENLKKLQLSYSFTEFKAAEQFPYNQQLSRISAAVIIHASKKYLFKQQFLRHFWIWINWKV